MKLKTIAKHISISLVVAELSFASAVNSAFRYQDYFDFGSNKGQYIPGKENLIITSKDGSRQVNFNAPMPDFSPANIEGGWKSEATNIGLSYVVTAAHMIESIERHDLFTYHTILNFGGVGSMLIAADNNFESYSTFKGKGNLDYATMRTNKFNLNPSAEINPNFNFVSIANENATNDLEKYKDNFWSSCNEGDNKCDYSTGKGGIKRNSSRYTYFAREGTGTQKLGFDDLKKIPVDISGPNNYHTGGFMNILANTTEKRFKIEFYNNTKESDGTFRRSDFSSAGAPGDSGSALYVYDSLDKKWYIIGVTSTSACHNSTHFCLHTDYVLINEAKIDEFATNHTISINGGNYTLSDNGLKNSNHQDMGAVLITTPNKGAISHSGNTIATTNFETFSARNKEMENTKDIKLKNSGTITLDSSIDLGAGGLITEKNSQWSINATDSKNWLILGGIFTDTGSKVTYNVRTLKNDYLHKIGSGELEITTSSPEAGLRIGEGTVTLNNNTGNLSFKEVYFTSGRGTLKIDKASSIDTSYIYFGSRGGTLDLNGQNLSFEKIYASDSGAILTNTSSTNSTLTFTSKINYLYHGQINSTNGGININFNTTQNIAFDGGIDNKQGILTINNGNLTFQGKPIVHAYLDPKTMSYANYAINNLKRYGEAVLNAPTSATQDDWLIRDYKFKELSINNSTFTLAHNATLETKKLTATNSTINLGSKNVWIDKQDGENVKTTITSSNLIYSNYGDDAKYGVGKDMEFKQELTQGESKIIENVKFIGDLDLKTNSSANLSYMDFIGNINADSTSATNLSNTNLTGNITSDHTLEINHSKIHGNISAKTFNASHSTFILDIDFDREKANHTISSTESTTGSNNTIQINPLNNPKENFTTPIILANLKDTSLQQNYFSIPKFNYKLSVFTPNVVFKKENGNAIWQLGGATINKNEIPATPIEPPIDNGNGEDNNTTTPPPEVPDKEPENPSPQPPEDEQPNIPDNSNGLFTPSENTQATQKANGLVNQILLSYVIEWNNMQKRMGELRDNPNNNGLWVRSFGGGGSDKDYQGNFFEVQLGADKAKNFSGAKLYIGGMLNYTKNTLRGEGLYSYNDSFGAGIYSSLIFDNGFYIDSILRYIYRKNTLNIDFIPGININTNADSQDVIFSIESGYRHLFAHNLFIQPQIELIAGYVGGFKVQNENIALEMKNALPLSSKIALFFGRQIVSTNTSTAEIYNIKPIKKENDTKENKEKITQNSNSSSSFGFRGGVGYAYDITKYGDKIFTDFITTPYFYKGIKDKRMFVNLSINYALGTKHRFNLEFEKSFFGILNIDWLINANYRFNF